MGRSLSASIALLHLVTIACTTVAATHYVRAGATGSATGNDWHNAYPAVPTTLTRGDTFFIAAGTYGDLCLDDPGEATISLLKATGDSHGTDNGWRSEYGTGVARFSSIDCFAGNYIIDGQSGGGPGSWFDGHGFEILFESTGFFFAEPVENIAIRHVLVHSPSITNRGTAIKGTVGSVTNLTVSHCAVHTFEGPHFHAKGWQNVLIERNYFGHNNSTPEWHAEFWSDLGNTNIQFRHNLFENIEGTAVFAGVNSGDSRDWSIHGNVFYRCTYLMMFCYESGSSSNKSTATGFRIYNNTVVGPGEGTIGIDRGSDNIVSNNLYYNIKEPQGYVVLRGATFKSNQFNDCDFRVTTLDATNKQDMRGNPFKQYSTEGLRHCDLSLAAPSTVQGTDLGDACQLDLTGISRGCDGYWDCGALEFDSHQSVYGTVPSLRLAGASATGAVFQLNGRMLRVRQNAPTAASDWAAGPANGLLLLHRYGDKESVMPQFIMR
ncbi:MAG: hypothetical protein GF331_26920 [Chitinivibrionales bacterium]|nr:hypothetical protein [Chitinivibrionales bacterium]